MKRRSDAAQALALEGWLDKVRMGFGDRIHPVDERVAELWGMLSATRSLPVIDGLIAATAMVHGLMVVTRNVRDLAPTGVPLLDPFAFSA